MSWRIKAGLKELLSRERDLRPPPSGGEVRITAAFPNTYRLAMSNLGFQTLFSLLGRRAEVEATRAFLPEPETLAEHRRTSTPWLTLEDQRAVADNEVIAFSLPFENDYLNLLTLLRLAALPLRAGLRGVGTPLIIGGGVAPTLNPEPLAPFLDLIILGEAEAVVDEFIDAYLELRDSPRAELLAGLAEKVEGVYAPGLYEPEYDSKGRLVRTVPSRPGLPARVRRRWAKELFRPAVSTVVSPQTEFGDRLLIEISRGCARACRFCAAGFLIRPPRRPPLEEVLKEVERGAEEVGRVGLVSAAVSDLPEVEELCLAAVRAGAKISVSSIRADTLSPKLARLLAEAGVQTLTLAPEAGSQRLRKVINKGLTEAEILEAAVHTLEAGIRNLRLYFMIGLPTETEEDVEAVAGLTKRIVHHLKNTTQGGGFNLITLSVSSFVPKPQTPFQWAAMNDLKTLQAKARIIKKGLKGRKRVRVTFDSPKFALLEGLIARGDRKVADFLEAAEEVEGSWPQALKKTNLNPDFYTLRERDPDEAFPWEIVDSGVERSFLWEEYRKALEEKESPGCLVGECFRCGVCGQVEAS